MKKIKIMTVVGTRPEIIRLSRVISKLDSIDVVDHVLVHTGQNYDYELNQIFFDDLQLRKPDYYLEAAGKNATDTAGRILIAVDPILENEKPDALLVLGDTNSCLSAIAAKKRKIPIFHMEAGNRCFDQRVPEETNRKIVDHISDINLPYSDIARQYLLSEGIEPSRVVKTGSPMSEVIQFYWPKINQSNILNELKLIGGNYFLVSAHREENISNRDSFNKLVELLNGLADKFLLPVIVSTHPRTRNMVENCSVRFHPNIKLLKPLSFSNYIALQLSARVVLSDSGTISEEASILNFSALNLRETHERPEAMEETPVMMVGLNLDRALQAITLIETDKNTNRQFILVSDYSKPNVSDKVVRIIFSYIDYVKNYTYFDGH